MSSSSQCFFSLQAPTPHVPCAFRYRPIVELMNANFGIYGMAELSSAGNTFATTGGQFEMPMTIIGAGGTAPNQSLGAEHSQPFHA